MNYHCVACDATVPVAGTANPQCECGGTVRFAEPPVPTEADRPPVDGPLHREHDLPEHPHDSRDSALDREAGLWAWSSFLPVPAHVHLGEGWTPLLSAPDREATYNCEWLSPTGSFKDRGAAVTIALAAELGVECVIEDSSGNAGAAIATYAARAGIDAEIYVPADASPAKRQLIERTGATVRAIEGSRADVTAACLDAVESGSGWYASHVYQPAFLEGTATAAYEIAAQRGWQAPDVLVTPVGHGTYLLGVEMGFRRLERAGWIERSPRLYGIQAAGVAPLVAARHGERLARGDNDLAEGIQIRNPPRSAEMQAALDRTDGDAIAIDRDRTATCEAALAAQGFHVEPTAAIAVAGFDRLRERGDIAADEETVIALNGGGRR